MRLRSVQRSTVVRIEDRKVSFYPPPTHSQGLHRPSQTLGPYLETPVTAPDEMKGGVQILTHLPNVQNPNPHIAPDPIPHPHTSPQTLTPASPQTISPASPETLTPASPQTLTTPSPQTLTHTPAKPQPSPCPNPNPNLAADPNPHLHT